MSEMVAMMIVRRVTNSFAIMPKSQVRSAK